MPEDNKKYVRFSVKLYFYIACAQILYCTFYLLLQPLLELGSQMLSKQRDTIC